MEMFWSQTVRVTAPLYKFIKNNKTVCLQPVHFWYVNYTWIKRLKIHIAARFLVIPGYLPSLHFISTFSFFVTSCSIFIHSQQLLLIGARLSTAPYWVSRARLLQPLGPDLASPSHFQLLISDWLGPSNKYLLAILGSPALRSIRRPWLPSALSHTNGNCLLVYSCWQGVPTSLSFGILEYTLPSSFAVHVVRGFLVFLSGYCVFFMWIHVKTQNHAATVVIIFPDFSCQFLRFCPGSWPNLHSVGFDLLIHLAVYGAQHVPDAVQAHYNY